MCHGSLYDPYGHHIGFVNNFYTELGSVQMNLELEDGRTFQFNPGDLLRDRQGDWRIRKPEESVLDSMRYMHWVDRVMEEAAQKEGGNRYDRSKYQECNLQSPGNDRVLD